MAKASNKKQIRKQVETKLAENFLDIKASVGDKKFAKKIKKAGKILSAGVAPDKNKPVAKKAATKVSDKKTAS